jgi:L,D-peptidoglycan transpeptidase YkuD (ErfK/YbiS/YcfS/YnhG family)
MLRSILHLFLLVLILAAALHSQSSRRNNVDSSTQLIVVTAPDWNSSQATLRRYARANVRAPWKEVGEPITVVVGKNGLAWGTGVMGVNTKEPKPGDPNKKEGDGRAPAGVFQLGTVFGYTTQPMPGWKMPYLYLNSSVECVDDTNSKFYNQIVDRSKVAPDWNSSERMLRSDDLYRWGVLVAHNYGLAEQGAGSCIFLHIWRGPGQPTVGCTAMPQSDLESLIAWLDPARTPLLVQLPATEYKELRKSRHWPSIEEPAGTGIKSVAKP